MQEWAKQNQGRFRGGLMGQMLARIAYKRNQRQPFAPAPAPPVSGSPSPALNPAMIAADTTGLGGPRRMAPRFNSNSSPAPFGAFLAKGGRVRPNRRYIVGEEGPEELVVDAPGSVIANKYPTETEVSLGIKPQNPLSAVRPTRQQQYGQPTITAGGGVAPGEMVIPPTQTSDTTRQDIGSIVGIAANALGGMVGQNGQPDQVTPAFTFTPVGGTVPRDYTDEYNDDEDVLFKRQLQRPIFRKRGGRVKPYQRYIVGEEGPEELILDTPGRVIANKYINDPPEGGQPRMQAPSPQPTETEAALGVTAQNPFNAVRPTRQQQYGEPSVSVDGRVPYKPFPMPVNPATGTAPTAPTPGATVAAPLSRREQLKKKIEERQNKTYNNKRGIKNTLKAAGIGFLQAFAQNAGLPLNERIMASLGGGAAGLVAGTYNPNLGSQLINKQKLADLYGQYGQATEMEEADAKAAEARSKATKAGLEITGTQIDNLNKDVKDYLATATADNNIDEMEAANLRRMTGKPYSANDWRKVVRFDDQGVPFIAREGEEGARIDPSRPLNPAEQVKPRTIEGQTYNVPDKTAFPVAGNVAVGNANRQQSASQYQQTAETTAANREFEDEKEYTKAVEDHRRRVLRAKADGKSAQARLTAAEGQLAKLQEKQAAIAGQGYDTSEIDRQITDVQNRITTAQGDLAAAQTLASEPAPKRVVRPKNPKGKGKKTYSPADVERVLRQ